MIIGTYTSDVSVTLPPIPPTISIGTYFGDDYISAIGDKIASLDKEEAKELLDYLKEKGL